MQAGIERPPERLDRLNLVGLQDLQRMLVDDSHSVSQRPHVLRRLRDPAVDLLDVELLGSVREGPRRVVARLRLEALEGNAVAAGVAACRS
jgi:hypothetical protein